jgi:DNA-binding NarL/FixJ family response regulator
MPLDARDGLLFALDQVEQLSEREQEVFLLLGMGASNTTAARMLHISLSTVKAHVARIMTKLGVESRLQAGLVSQEYQRRRSAGAVII